MRRCFAFGIGSGGALAFVLTCTSTTSVFGASFDALGILPAETRGEPTAISSNGSVIGGYSNIAGGSQGTIWTAGSGIQGLGNLPGTHQGHVMGVSSDGSLATGYSVVTGSGDEIYQWTSVGGLKDTGVNLSGSLRATTPDGTAIVGDVSGSGSAYRWTSAAGVVHFGSVGKYSMDAAGGISADGSTVVGYGSATGGSSQHALRWTSATGLQDLGVISSDSSAASAAFGASADGSVVVGWTSSSIAYDAFRWTAVGGLQDLGHFAGGDAAFASSCSADGSVVVGLSQSASGYEPFVWDAADGMRSIHDVLVADGIDLSGWTFTDSTGASENAVAVSADGSTITGYARFNGQMAAWSASLVPEPATPMILLVAAAPAVLRRRRA